jgi:hypothetical protein
MFHSTENPISGRDTISIVVRSDSTVLLTERGSEIDSHITGFISRSEIGNGCCIKRTITIVNVKHYWINQQDQPIADISMSFENLTSLQIDNLSNNGDN